VKTVNLIKWVGDFAEDKDKAALIRESDIRPCLEKGEPIVLDFTGITLATQSFVHALISDLLRAKGEIALDLIEFKGCSASVKGIVETVVQYSLDTMDDDVPPQQAPEAKQS
jgi:hypothetical protein